MRSFLCRITLFVPLLTLVLAIGSPTTLPTVDENTPAVPRLSRLRDRLTPGIESDYGERGTWVTLRTPGTPYPLNDPDALPIVTPKHLRSEPASLFRSWRPRTFPLTPPATNKDMALLLDWRPYRVFRSEELLAVTDSPLSVDGHQVIQLPGGILDRQIMTMMTRKGNSFYVRGGKGKIWHFTKSGANSFTYTDRIKRADRERVKHALSGRSGRYSWFRMLAQRTKLKLERAAHSFKSFTRG